MKQAKFWKFLSLRPHPLTLDQSQLVVILSKWDLNDKETALLSNGLKFSTMPKKIPTEEIIASTESLARKGSEPRRGTLLRYRAQRCLKESK